MSWSSPDLDAHASARAVPRSAVAAAKASVTLSHELFTADDSRRRFQRLVMQRGPALLPSNGSAIRSNRIRARSVLPIRSRLLRQAGFTSLEDSRAAAPPTTR